MTLQSSDLVFGFSFPKRHSHSSNFQLHLKRKRKNIFPRPEQPKKARIFRPKTENETPKLENKSKKKNKNIMGKGGEKEQEEKKELLEKEFRSLLRPPPLAIPTAALGVSVLLLHSFLSYLYVVGVLPAFVVLPVLYLTSFAAFTVVHDAVHHSISPK